MLGGTALLCFSSDMWLGFKVPNFRDPMQHRPALILWGKVLPHCGWCVSPRKIVAQPHSGSQFMVKHSKKLAPRFAALSQYLSLC